MSDTRQLKLFDLPEPPDGGYIFRMTITLKNGRVIRRANGKPFKIKVKQRD